MKVIKNQFLIAVFLIVSYSSFAQVGIGTTTPKGALDVSSTTAGFIMPRVTTIERTAMTVGTDQIGMQVYDTNTKTIWFYDGTNWINQGNVISGTTTNNTLRWDGTNWVESTALTNDDTTVTATNVMVVNGSTVGRGSGNILSNTTLGVEALYSNTTGDLNTAIGAEALYSNTTRDLNTAIGARTLYTNTTGYLNTAAIGAEALYFNTTGFLNTAIGRDALAYNTTGYRNTATGNAVLISNTTGYDNTAIGNYALTSNDTGIKNVTVGLDAANRNETGNNNVAIGSSALALNSAGSQNVAIGSTSLHDFDITSGNGNNTVLGYNTGRGITTGTNNTILGANVVGLVGGLSNNIIIADGTGNQRINIDASGRVGIGTANQSSAVHAVTAVGSQGFKHGNGSVALNTIMGSNYAGIGSLTNHRLAFYTNNGSEKMTVLPNGNVGVGTISPLSTLHVESLTKGYGFRHTQGSIGLSTFIGNDFASFGTLTNHRLSFFTNGGNSSLVVTKDGKIAIGPGFKDASSRLHIRHDQDAITELRIDNENSGTNIDHTSLTLYDGPKKRGFFNQNNNTNVLSMGQASNGGQVSIYSAGAEAIRVSAIGNVGIGTTTPIAPLDVTSHLVVGTPTGQSHHDRFDIYSTNSSGSKKYWNIINKFDVGQNLLFRRGGSWETVLALEYNGQRVGIGTATPTQKLHVNGNIFASGTITPDYVFEKYYDGKSSLKDSYKMLSLNEVENFTRKHKHLPGVPSAKEVQVTGGILVNRATEINLEKIEELYLHTIEQQKQITEQSEQIALLQAQVNTLLEDLAPKE